jgi:putative Mn2+ efflux pump MntP
VLGLLTIGIAVGLGNFAASIGIGLTGIDARTRLRVGVCFGVFEALMPLVGLVIGRSVAGSLGDLAHVVGGAFLIGLGVYSLVVRRGGGDVTQARGGRFLLTAFALSLDNLVVGFALGVYNVPLVVSALVIGTISVLMSLIGLELGQRLGRGVEERSEELSAAVLILVGVAVGAGVL